MPIVAAKSGSRVAVSQQLRTLGALPPTSVKGFDGNAAAMREIVIIGKKDVGGWEIKAVTKTDSLGNYAVTLPLGPKDKCIIVGVGDPTHAEYTRVLGDMVGVI